jgi:ribosomal protein L13E
LSEQSPKKVKAPSKTIKKPSKTIKKSVQTTEKKIKKPLKIEETIEEKIEKPSVITNIPKAVVSRHLKHITKIRQGKGFSRPEISSIGLNVSKARSLGLHVDSRRTTKWDKNVEDLKKWFTKDKTKTKTKKVKDVSKVKK